MAKSKNGPTFLSELLSVGLYKRNQGRMTRQLTSVMVGLILFWGSWTISNFWLLDQDSLVRIGVPVAIFALGAWVIYRLVNYPRVADFLISVEAEMDKVSWASWPELYRSTIVVICTMLFLGVTLFVFDYFWQEVFTRIGILRMPN